MIVTLKTICDFFGITKQGFSKWQDEGCPGKEARGKYDLKKVFDFWRQNKLPQEGDRPSLIEERRKKIEVERKLKELEYEIETGRYILRATIAEALRDRAQAVKGFLLALPKTLAEALQNKDRWEVSHILKKSIWEALNLYTQSGGIFNEKEYASWVRRNFKKPILATGAGIVEPTPNEGRREKNIDEGEAGGAQKPEEITKPIEAEAPDERKVIEKGPASESKRRDPMASMVNLRDLLIRDYKLSHEQGRAFIKKLIEEGVQLTDQGGVVYAEPQAVQHVWESLGKTESERKAMLMRYHSD